MFYNNGKYVDIGNIGAFLNVPGIDYIVIQIVRIIGEEYENNKNYQQFYFNYFIMFVDNALFL